MTNLCRLDGSVLGITENGIKSMRTQSYWRAKMPKLEFRAWVYYGDKIEKPHYSRDWDSLSRFFEDHDEKDNEQCIEQSTGLKDRFGKEIYEGDILQYFGATLVVEFQTEAFWAVRYDSREAWNIRKFIGVSGAAVIGNIHENLELLGEYAETWRKLKKSED